MTDMLQKHEEDPYTALIWVFFLSFDKSLGTSHLYSVFEGLATEGNLGEGKVGHNQETPDHHVSIGRVHNGTPNKRKGECPLTMKEEQRRGLQTIDMYLTVPVIPLSVANGMCLWLDESR